MVALLLILLDGLVTFLPGENVSSPASDPVLSVKIYQNEAEPVPELDIVEEPIPPDVRETETTAERVPAPQEPPPSEPNDPIPTEKPSIDWAGAINETVGALAIRKTEREDARQTMWRQTHSVMFRQSNEFVPKEQQPVADLHFKPELHVVGLGFKIGSCFVGVPLVGVPVEERTVGIRLFVCANDSG